MAVIPSGISIQETIVDIEKIRLQLIADISRNLYRQSKKRYGQAIVICLI